MITTEENIERVIGKPISQVDVYDIPTYLRNSEYINPCGQFHNNGQDKESCFECQTILRSL
jgi:hypothetical protein